MTVSGIYNKARDGITYTAHVVREKAVVAKDWTTEKVSGMRKKIVDHSVWQNEVIKGPYERKIKPIDTVGKGFIGTGLAIAVVVMTLALKVFNPAFFAICAMASALVIIESYSIAAHRVRNHFDEKAWDEVDAIRQAVITTVGPCHDFAEITTRYGNLSNGKEYSHREDAIKKDLKDHLENYKRDMCKNNLRPEDWEGAKNTFVAHLKGLQGKLASHKPLVDGVPPLVGGAGAGAAASVAGAGPSASVEEIEHKE